MTVATVSITQSRPRVVVSREGGPSITISATGRPQVQITPTGLRGPPGPLAETLTAVAIGPLSALRVVALASGGVELVDPALAPSLARMIGVTTIAAASGASVTVRQAGMMSDAAWAWVPGAALFCGAGGVLTSTAPATVASRQIGVAIDATTILIDPSDLIILE